MMVKTDLMRLTGLRVGLYLLVGTRCKCSLYTQGTGAVQKGMPHKVYHGKTGKHNVLLIRCSRRVGRVYNVTPHGLGVIVNKKLRQGRQTRPTSSCAVPVMGNLQF